MVKPLPIILIAIGALVGILAFVPLLASVPVLKLITKPQMLIVAATLVVIGVLLMARKQEEAPAEVPIYQGQSQEVVGYRRHQSK